MRPVRILLLLALGASSLPAPASAGGSAACEAFRIVYATTQPLALWPEATVRSLLGFRQGLVERLRQEQGREVLTRHASGISRIDRRYLMGDGKYLGIGPNGLPVILYRLRPYSETEWIFPNQARIYRDSERPGLRFKPGLAGVPPLTYVAAQAQAITGRFGIKRTGGQRYLAGRRSAVSVKEGLCLSLEEVAPKGVRDAAARAAAGQAAAAGGWRP